MRRRATPLALVAIGLAAALVASATAAVGDVAEAVGKAVEGELKPGKTYELGGPDVLTNRELVERVLRYANRRNPVLPLPSIIGKILAFPMGILPKPLITGEQVRG